MKLNPQKLILVLWTLAMFISTFFCLASYQAETRGKSGNIEPLQGLSVQETPPYFRPKGNQSLIKKIKRAIPLSGLRAATESGQNTLDIPLLEVASGKGSTFYENNTETPQETAYLTNPMADAISGAKNETSMNIKGSESYRLANFKQKLLSTNAANSYDGSDLFYENHMRPKNSEIQSTLAEIFNGDFRMQEKIIAIQKGLLYNLKRVNRLSIKFAESCSDMSDFFLFWKQGYDLLQCLQILKGLNFDRLAYMKHYKLYYLAQDMIQEVLNLHRICELGSSEPVEIPASPVKTFDTEDFCVEEFEIMIRFVYIDYSRNRSTIPDAGARCKELILKETLKYFDPKIEANLQSNGHVYRRKVRDDFEHQVQRIVERRCFDYMSDGHLHDFSRSIVADVPANFQCRFPMSILSIAERPDIVKIHVIFVNSPRRRHAKDLTHKIFFLPTDYHPLLNENLMGNTTS